jgi:dTDP-4-amino-4,6-dideoxygalactose transaminase
MLIPYSHQYIDEDDIQSVINVLQSDFLTDGPETKKFELMVSEYIGCKYSVAVSNCTSALYLSLLVADIKENQEVITTSNTFVATANVIKQIGAIPVFADIDPNTYNIDPEDIKRKITNKTKAIIPVHFAGRTCDMEEIYKIAKQYSLIVIEDGAHSFSAQYNYEKIGNLDSLTTCFSFHSVKPLVCGEGSIITTNNEQLYKKLLALRNHGRINGQQIYLGYNYRMTDIQSALGLSQLKKIDWLLNERKAIVSYYVEKLSNNSQIKLPILDSTNNQSSWHLFVIQISNRDKVKQYLNDHGIGAQIHYIPVYYHPYYQELGYQKGLCPIAESYYENCLSLPLYPGLTQEQQDYVIKTLEEALNEF